MEDEFYNDEFEQFLKQQANHHRMYPSDGLWGKIYKQLHKDKKWPALTIAALIFISAIISLSIYFGPEPNIFSITSLNSPTQNTAEEKQNAFNAFAQKTITDSAAVASNKLSVRNTDFIPTKNYNTSKPTTERSVVVLTTQLENSSAVFVPTNIGQADAKPALRTVVETLSMNNNSSIRHLYNSTDKKTTDTKQLNIAQTLSLPIDTTRRLASEAAAKQKQVDDFIKEHESGLAAFTTAKQKSVKNKFSYQIYFTPSVSYRKLTEDRSLTHDNPNTGGPVALNYVTNVNKVVRHKPGTGVELGLNFRYHLTETFRLKGGIQFNVRQYNIQAYKSSTEIATIALINGSGIDSVNSYAFYRNNNGYSSTELVNRYHQLSVPIGFEWNIIGNKKAVQVNVAANVQPTYLLNKNVYLLSTNFKNYTENPDMLRNWNLNTSVEAFVSYKVGDFTWQLGPHVRYQHYSTFIKAYPIRENLVDYGLKIGVSKIIR